MNRVKRVVLLSACLMICGCSVNTNKTKNTIKVPKEYEGLVLDMDIEANNYGPVEDFEYKYHETQDKSVRYYYPYKEGADEKYYLNYSYLTFEIIPGESFIREERAYRVWTLGNQTSDRELDPNRTDRYYETTQYLVQIIDMKTGKLQKEIDVKEIVGSNYPDYQIANNGALGRKIIPRDNELYWPIELFSKPKELKVGRMMDVQVLLVNVRTGEHKLSATPYEDYTMIYMDDTSDPYSIVNATNIKSMNNSKDGVMREGVETGFVEKPRVWLNTQYEDVVVLSLFASGLPINNEKFYNLFPDLKELQNLEENQKEWLSIVIEFDAKEYSWQDIVSLLTENGEPITYDGWTMWGTDIPITSEEEYYQLRGTSEENFQKELERITEILERARSEQ